jgi:uncharacterized protein YxeA
MKRVLSVVTLLVMVSVNIMTPFSYAFADEQISPTPLYQEGQESSEDEEDSQEEEEYFQDDEDSSLTKEGDHEVVEDLPVE